MCETREIVYIVRHAAPQPGTGIRYDVPPGPPLSAEGRAEAQRTAAFLADKEITRILSSPLVRARDTAGIIGQTLHVQPVEDARLAEHHADETFERVTDRLRAFWEANYGEGAPWALVTHGSPVRALLTILGDGQIDLSSYNFDSNIVPTAGVWRAEREAEGWGLELVFRP